MEWLELPLIIFAVLSGTALALSGASIVVWAFSKIENTSSWEYFIVDTSKDGNPDNEYELNELNKEGWELITIKIEVNGSERWYFKRKK